MIQNLRHYPLYENVYFIHRVTRFVKANESLFSHFFSEYKITMEYLWYVNQNTSRILNMPFKNIVTCSTIVVNCPIILTEYHDRLIKPSTSYFIQHDDFNLNKNCKISHNHNIENPVQCTRRNSYEYCRESNACEIFMSKTESFTVQNKSYRFCC